MTPLIGLPDSLVAESYPIAQSTFTQLANSGGIGLPDSVNTESNGGSLTTVSQFSQWSLQNWNITQWALVFVAGWGLAEIFKKKGF